MRVLLALSFLLLVVACDKMKLESKDDAGTQEIDVELEQEAQELDKLGVERDMLETKVQITKEQLVEMQGQLDEATTAEQKAAASKRRDKAQQEHKSAEAELAKFKREAAAH